MKTLALILAFAAIAAGQKQLKAGKHKSPQYIATSPGGAGPESAPPSYQSGGGGGQYQGSVSNHGGFGGGHGGGHGGSPSYSSGIGKPGSAKASYPLLLSDTRTLNTDGTINFNYQADNGLHQGETVDKDGTRRGFYSYPGADGKLITVKYTAGKNGFVAEGDHLPTQPQSAPYDPKQESHDYSSSGKQGSHHGGSHHGGSQHGGLSSLGGGRGNYHHAAPVHHGGHHGGQGGAYRQGGQNNANVYSHSSIGGGHGSGHGGSASFANFPDFTSQFASGSPSFSSGAGAGRYSGAGAHGAGHHGGSGAHISGHPGGSSSFSSLAALGAHGAHGVNTLLVNMAAILALISAVLAANSVPLTADPCSPSPTPTSPRTLPQSMQDSTLETEVTSPSTSPPVLKPSTTQMSSTETTHPVVNKVPAVLAVMVVSNNVIKQSISIDN